MIEFRTGDILNVQAEALVNTVNCVGIMGRGVALQFKEAFPANFKAYQSACTRGDVQPGRMFVFETGFVSDPKFIINFPTKRHWRGKSRLDDIDAGLEDLVRIIRSNRIRSIAIPPLGSGLGGLNWVDVRPRIEAALSQVPDVRAIVFEPRGDLNSTSSTNTARVPTMTPGRAALVGLMRRYLEGLLDPFVSLLEVHKLMYFMQEAGEPLKLRFKAAPYGPYADNLRHVLREIEGYFVAGYADGGDTPGKELSLVPGAVEDAETFLTNHVETHARFDRVAALVDGFESAFGLELLATVHWVATRGSKRTELDIQAAVYAWGDRKRQFTPRQIGLALQVLSEQGWIPANRLELPN
jgi:O-acetyl-ADP-ribose deacetylase (regulator of RNase III)